MKEVTNTVDCYATADIIISDGWDEQGERKTKTFRDAVIRSINPRVIAFMINSDYKQTFHYPMDNVEFMGKLMSEEEEDVLPMPEGI